MHAIKHVVVRQPASAETLPAVLLFLLALSYSLSERWEIESPGIEQFRQEWLPNRYWGWCCLSPAQQLKPWTSSTQTQSIYAHTKERQCKRTNKRHTEAYAHTDLTPAQSTAVQHLTRNVGRGTKTATTQEQDRLLVTEMEAFGAAML